MKASSRGLIPALHKCFHETILAIPFMQPRMLMDSLETQSTLNSFPIRTIISTFLLLLTSSILRESPSMEEGPRCHPALKQNTFQSSDPCPICRSPLLLPLGIIQGHPIIFRVSLLLMLYYQVYTAVQNTGHSISTTNECCLSLAQIPHRRHVATPCTALSPQALLVLLVRSKISRKIRRRCGIFG